MTGPGSIGHTSAAMRNLVIPFLLVLLLGCSGDSDLGEEWTAITAEDFPLAFAPDELRGAIARYLKSTRYYKGRAILTHQASWKAPSARLPRAELRLEQYGRAFVIAQNPETAVSRLMDSIFEGRRPAILVKNREVNTLGTIDYLVVRDETAECVVFSQSWRRESILNLLQGLYCIAPGSGFSDTRIATLLRSLKPK